MGILGLIGLKTAGPYCFYTISKGTAILVGIKTQQGKPVVVPEQIGRYTVRGIDDAVCSGPLGNAMNALDQKTLLRLQQKLNTYHRASSLRMDQLPQTIEYIGFSMVSSNNTPIHSLEHHVLRIPAHIRYIRDLRPSISFHKLIFPQSLRYLGAVHSSASLTVEYSGPGSSEEPVHSLSDYLGKPMEEVPQLGDLAFARCSKLTTLNLPDSIQKIGKGALPSKHDSFQSSYKLHIPKLLTQADPQEFQWARVETITYPEDLSPELRCRKLPLVSISHLIINDLGQLEEYMRLVAQGENPDTFPDKCLYHLIRVANRVVIPQAPKRIYDSLFAGCKELYQVTIGAMPEQVNTALAISDGVQIIEDHAFAFCPRLMPEPFPASLRHIGQGAFQGSSVKTLALPEGLVYIGPEAFAKCPKLTDFNIPSTLKELAPDAFSGCDQLRLTPELLKRLEDFPGTKAAIVLPWEANVRSFTESGDRLLFKPNITISDKQEAYLQYRRALKLDPFCTDVMYRLEQLLLSEQVPHCITAFELSNLHDALKSQNSLELLAYFESTLAMLDSMCTILSDPDDLITQRLVYGLNCDQTAAAKLLEFLLDQVQLHPNITFGARHKISSIAGHIFCTPTRNQDEDSKILFEKQKQRYQKTFPGEYYTTEWYNAISALTSEKLMALFHDAMAKDEDQSFRDAELWLEIARTFNPAIEIPEAFRNRQSKYRDKRQTEKYMAAQEQLVFPNAPPLSMPSWSFPVAPEPEASSASYRYLDKEEEDRLNQLVSDYWAEQAAKQEAAEIESLWGDLCDIGFWDDTSWQ